MVDIEKASELIVTVGDNSINVAYSIDPVYYTIAAGLLVLLILWGILVSAIERDNIRKQMYLTYQNEGDSALTQLTVDFMIDNDHIATQILKMYKEIRATKKGK